MRFVVDVNSVGWFVWVGCQFIGATSVWFRAGVVISFGCDNCVWRNVLHAHESSRYVV
jgi:hypothetical protein